MIHTRRRWLCRLATLFVLLHVSVVLLRGGPPWLREPLWGLVAWYGDGLRMAETWGMFSRPPEDVQVFVYGVDEHGGRVELATSNARERKLWNRIVDVRLRKMQTRLVEEGHRNAWGKHYLDYYCRQGADEPRWQHVELELLRAHAEPKPKAGEVMLRVNCASKSATSAALR